MATSPDLGYGSPDSYDPVKRIYQRPGQASQPMADLSRPMAILSKPMAVLSRLMPILSKPMAVLSRPMPIYQAKRKRDFRAGLGSRA